MTKLRIFTDREYRYKNRTHNKHITELTGIIKNKTNDNNNYNLPLDYYIIKYFFKGFILMP